MSKLSVRYDRPDKLGKAEIYVSVFEARDIYKFSIRDQGSGTRMDLLEDVQIVCHLPSKTLGSA